MQGGLEQVGFERRRQTVVKVKIRGRSLVISGKIRKFAAPFRRQPGKKSRNSGPSQDGDMVNIYARLWIFT
jgi:hypothetical protein